MCSSRVLSPDIGNIGIFRITGFSRVSEKAAEGYIVGYSAHNKAYRVYNLAAKKIEETLNLKFLEGNENCGKLEGGLNSFTSF
jgi:hypothetical protein